MTDESSSKWFSCPGCGALISKLLGSYCAGCGLCFILNKMRSNGDHSKDRVLAARLNLVERD